MLMMMIRIMTGMSMTKVKETLMVREMPMSVAKITRGKLRQQLE
jgi:hypothetical protein